jgi:lipoyl-dependent peroxiredoxin
MATVRRADVEWIGGFVDGEGKILKTTSGALPELDVTWTSRVDDEQGMTSPEELLAAAHASCFAMQFTSGLVGSGWEPEEMRVSCEVSFEVGLGVTQSALTARVTVPGLTDEQIYEIAQRAKIMCPISRALAAIEITLELPDLVLEEEEDAEGGAETEPGGVTTATDE